MSGDRLSKYKPKFSDIACVQCGGQRIYSKVTLEYGRNLVAKAANAKVFGSAYTFILSAICTRCGLVSLYAEKPDVLLPEQPITEQAITEETPANEIAAFIRQNYSEKSRYEIDRHLLELNYNPSELETAWQDFLKKS